MATEIELAGARVVWSDAADGNLDRRVDPDVWRGFHDRPWMYAHQVHGDTVLVVDDVITFAGSEADASVTTSVDVPLGVMTADCAPIALVSPQGVVAAVHAGWRGMRSGIVQATAARMRECGAEEIHAALGPCIHVECYAFESPDLATVVAVLGGRVVGRDAQGVPALDMVEATHAACEQAGVVLEYVHRKCTACDESYFSHRARQDTGRQVMLVWRS